jgi:regulator of protease activity HflC (stomatin/prohibitin superfamily)
VKIKNRTHVYFTSSIILVFVLYLMSGTYSLENGQKALVVRFGEVVKEVPGPSIRLQRYIPVRYRQSPLQRNWINKSKG